ncbi:septin -like protein [Labeo rohita]|uniref:Septin-like protein n=1 Tax=Labeo rohita TaxID=84645 RepID=A0A498M8N0_LABRO|nr:septin -like protein [Labeo rohita]RXN38012.1 septin -like protein [Labeo rohita]
MDHHHYNSDCSDDSGVSDKSIDRPPAFNNDGNQSDELRARYDATLIKQGLPALFQLNTKRNQIDGSETKIRQWTYGQKDRNNQNKVILMVGESGAGKTTMINTMINYSLGVKFEDQEFYQITEETEDANQSQSQTHEITVYEVFVEENRTSLTIIDTPGYAHTEGYEKDREISEYLIRLFSDEDRIRYIDAVCFVMKASQNRLSKKELYVFHSVLSILGKDIENSIMFLMSQSDGLPPTDALNAITTAEIPCRRNMKEQPVHLLFNNRQKDQRDEQYKSQYKSAWKMGEESMEAFFKLLEENNRKSVVMTLDVLKERRRLDACVKNLKWQINEKELKTEELNQIQEAIGQNRDKIQDIKNAPCTVTKKVKVKVLIENKSWRNKNATCCSVCQENCHVRGCWWVKDLSWCEVMENNHCTVCTRKCHYSEHVQENKKYEIREKQVIMTFDELRREYKCTEISFDKVMYENTEQKLESIMKESEMKMKTEEKLKSDLEKIQNEKSNLLHEAYISVMILSKIALKSDSTFTLQSLDFLIPRLKEEGKEEWMKNLEDMRKAGEEQRNKWDSN